MDANFLNNKSLISNLELFSKLPNNMLKINEIFNGKISEITRDKIVISTSKGDWVINNPRNFDIRIDDVVTLQNLSSNSVKIIKINDDSVNKNINLLSVSAKGKSYDDSPQNNNNFGYVSLKISQQINKDFIANLKKIDSLKNLFKNKEIYSYLELVEDDFEEDNALIGTVSHDREKLLTELGEISLIGYELSPGHRFKIVFYVNEDEDIEFNVDVKDIDEWDTVIELINLLKKNPDISKNFNKFFIQLDDNFIINLINFTHRIKTADINLIISEKIKLALSGNQEILESLIEDFTLMNNCFNKSEQSWQTIFVPIYYEDDYEYIKLFHKKNDYKDSLSYQHFIIDITSNQKVIMQLEGLVKNDIDNQANNSSIVKFDLHVKYIEKISDNLENDIRDIFLRQQIKYKLAGSIKFTHITKITHPFNKNNLGVNLIN